MSAPEAVAEGEIVSIETHATDVAGRFIVSAGHNHFVSDSRPAAGGPGEAVQAGQLLLASLTSCGLGLIQGRAAELGVVLTSSDVNAAFQRHTEDKTRYQWIRLVFTLGGVDAATAATLVAHFTDTCPIFNTLKRGGTITAEARTA
ncbi:MAG: OsmC family protein [Polaromonas sp.]|nr:OsmC family protein [Polaromonas sp.]